MKAERVVKVKPEKIEVRENVHDEEEKANDDINSTEAEEETSACD